jgi:hypothetical protein
MKFKLDRRTFLRGAVLGAAATLALPPLEIMLNSNGTAFADGAPLPKRFGVFFWGNGVVPRYWVPQGTGTDWTPGEELLPLVNAGLKDYISVVSGHDIKTGNPRGHHAGAAGILSGAPLIPQDPGSAGYASTFSAPSIDQIVAGHIGIESRFRSIEFGVDPRVSTSEGTTLQHLSHNGPDNVNPAEYNPHRLFTRLFGEGFVEVGNPEPYPRLALRRHILDAVREDSNHLRQKLGAADRARLDQHLEGIGALQHRLRSIEEAPLPPSACLLPTDPGNIGHDTAERQPERARAMADLLAIALACDQTRVWSNLFNGSVSGTIYWGIDPTTNFHQLTHDEPGDQPKVHAIVQFIMEEFAYLLNALKNTAEGDGNLLDNSVILATSDCNSGYAHSITDYPILVAGKGGGKLRTGLHVRGNGANTSRVLLTCLRAMDCPFDAFGAAGGRTDVGISELEV